MESNLEKTLRNETVMERSVGPSTYKSSRSRLRLPLPSKARVMGYLRGVMVGSLGAVSLWLGYVAAANWMQYGDFVGSLSVAAGSALFAGMALDAAGYRRG